jgi:hypothetical protein
MEVASAGRHRFGLHDRLTQRGGQPVTTPDDREPHAILQATLGFDQE